MQNIFKIKRLNNRTIRYVWQERECFFLIEDFIIALTDFDPPHLYWWSLKAHIIRSKLQEMQSKWSLLKIIEVKIEKKYCDYTNREGLFVLLKYCQTDKTELMIEWLNSLDLTACFECQTEQKKI